MSAHLLDDLFSHCVYEVLVSGIHGAGKHEVLPNLKTHISEPPSAPQYVHQSEQSPKIILEKIHALLK